MSKKLIAYPNYHYDGQQWLCTLLQNYECEFRVIIFESINWDDGPEHCV